MSYNNSTMEISSKFELTEGRNCRRRTRIEEGAFILSGRSYFRAFRQAVLQAERYVYILAWDLSESVKLVRDDDFEDGHPASLSDFIFSVLNARPGLEIYILLWDYTLVWPAEREWLPFTERRTREQPRLHFKVDDAINFGASHHQKVVVADDALAFCGGFDLCGWRWDTREHRPHDPRRTGPSGKLYQPYHDVHLAVTGEAALRLGDVCASRWRRATGEDLPRLKSPPQEKRLPQCLSRDFENTAAAIALTCSAFKKYSTEFQIERLYLDVINSSRNYIYIENQYLSSQLIANALISSLHEPEGPEIVLVMTRDMDLIEESAMGLLRDRLLEKIAKADRYDRFSAYYPCVVDESGNEIQVYVHAKILISDDRIVVAGSANLSVRSLRIDSEIDLVLDFEETDDVVRSLLCRLLAIHLGSSEEIVNNSLRDAGSLYDLIKEIGVEGRHNLKKLEPEIDSPLRRKIADTRLLNPDEPLSPAFWMREADRMGEGEESGKPKWRSYLLWGGVLLTGVFLVWLLGVLWEGVIDREQAVAFLENLRNSRAAIPAVLVIFVVVGLIGAPINVFLVAATIAVGPWIAFAGGFGGSLLSALLAFAVGSRVGKPLVQKVAGKNLKKLSRKVARHGIISVAMIRLVPFAPYVVVNLVAGFSHIGFSSFLFGSILGLLPGMVAVVWLTHMVDSVFTNPQKEILTIAAGFAAAGAAIYLLRRKLKS